MDVSFSQLKTARPVDFLFEVPKRRVGRQVCSEFRLQLTDGKKQV
jgi:hypothetical protein